MSGITVTRRGTRLLASKAAATDHDADRRRREAEVLAGIHHPGVVELADLHEGPPLELHTGFVGTDTWARRPPATDQDRIEGLVSLASTVADLHALDIAHRALAADHVLVAADGRPVLCGLADAGPADTDGRAEDLGALGRLLDALAADAGPDVAASLSALGRRAATGELTAATLASELAALDPRPIHGPAHRRPSRPPAILAVAAVAVVGLAAAAWWSTRDHGDAAVAFAAAPSSTSPPPSTTTFSASTTTPPTTSSTTSSPSAPAPAPQAAPASEDAPAPTGLVVEHGGRRYAVGGPDHVAALGDWNCDGAESAAVLDPADGTIAVFAAWPLPGETLTSAVTATVAGATGIGHTDDGTCGQLRVLHDGGSTLLTPEFP